MSTASLHCRVLLQRLQGVRFNAPFPSGGFLAGPRALRPERLQWLTTSAVNRQAFIRNRMWSLDAAFIAKGSPSRSIYEVDTVRSEALEELPRRQKDVAHQGRASAHLSSTIVIGLEANVRQKRTSVLKHEHVHIEHACAGASPPTSFAPALFRKVEQLFGRGRFNQNPRAPP